MDNETLSRQLEAALLDLDRDEVRRLIQQGVGPSAPTVAEFADQVVAPALRRIGDGWEAGQVALSQVFMAGRLMESALADNLLPVHRQGAPRVGIGVLGDHHTLGKNMVATALRLGGYEVIDLGAGLSPRQLVEAAVAQDVSVLLISVLMLHRALQVQEVVDLLATASPVRIPVVVGGAPFLHDPRLWRRVGADATGRNAADAIELVRRLGRGA